MRVAIAVLADYANVTREGKLNIMGIFNQLQGPRFPLVHPLMHLVVRLSLHGSEAGKKQKMTVRLADEDGDKLMEISGEGILQGEKPGAFDADQILSLANLTFPKPGTYSFDISVNDEHRASVPLKLALVLPPPTDAAAEGV